MSDSDRLYEWTVPVADGYAKVSLPNLDKLTPEDIEFVLEWFQLVSGRLSARLEPAAPRAQGAS